MNLIYKIGEFYLYDGQFDYDYLILYNRRPTRNQNLLTSDGKYFDDIDYGFRAELPWEFSRALNTIYNLDPDIRNEESIKLMTKAAQSSNCVMVKLLPDSLSFVKKESTHLLNYNGYWIYYDETITGINLMDFELAAHWKIGQSGYSTFRLFEFKHCREESIDIMDLQNHHQR